MVLSNAEMLAGIGALVGAVFGYGKLYQKVADLGRRMDALEPIMIRLGASWLFQEHNPPSEVDIHRIDKVRKTGGRYHG